MNPSHPKSLRPAARAALCILALYAHAPLPVAAEEAPWHSEGTRDGIAIYTRHLPGQPLRDFKGVVQIDAPIAQVAATLADVPTMHEWFYLLQEARFLRSAYTTDSDMYMSIKGIWPMSPRDVVMRVLVRRDPATQALHIDANSIDGLMPPQPGFVRIPAMRSSWTLRPISPTRTEAQIEGHGHPGGWIPLPIANFAVTTLPRQILTRLREHVAKPEYRDMETVYAKNPKLRALAGRLGFAGE